MEFKIGNEYNGFKLIRKEFIQEIDSTGFIFEHIKTKARLVKLQNKDNEKAFSIGFKTITDDDTGCPHILEHSVLCGSKKFPMKDPFSSVVRSCITTFINAFTFPDKTVYPFSTTNTSEFFKIMEVYLDAVFAPNVITNENFFKQEGWRFVLPDKNAEIEYSGVVYGEMKGALSSPMQVLEYASLKNLFPNTFYKNNSGGDPKAIVDLKYSDFVNFYKKHYHPTNSYIYLYGNGDLFDELRFINEEYLSKYEFNKDCVDIKIDLQKSFDSEKKEVVEYFVQADDNKNKYILSYNWGIGDSRNFEESLSLSILKDILLGTNASPLKKALIDANLGEDMFAKYEGEILQEFLQVNILNSKVENQGKFKEIIYNVLNELVEKGIDKNLIEAAIHSKEFYFKEQIDYADGLPRGLMFMVSMMKTWLYDADPFLTVKFNSAFESIKCEVEKGNFFENLIKEKLIDNNHKLFLILKPSNELNLEKDVKEKLTKYKESLSEDEIELLVKETFEFEKWQAEPETEANLNSIKMIEKSEIDLLPVKNNLIERDINGVKFYCYNEKTNEVNYVNLMFDAKVVGSLDLQYLGILASVLSQIKTKDYDFDEFANFQNLNVGGLSFSITPFYNKQGVLESKFVVGIKFIDEKKEKAIEILNEVFNNVLFDEKKILEILQKIKSRQEISFVESGHSTVFSRVSSYYDVVSHYKDLIGGMGFYNFVKDLVENFDVNKNVLIQKLEEIYSVIFNKKNLLVNLNGKNLDVDIFGKLELKDNDLKVYDYDESSFDFKKLNEGFKTSASVNYVAKGFDFKKLGFDFNGSFLVLKNILRYSYLWDEVRVKKGAYGSGVFILRTGNFVFWSYRDPNIVSTFNTYDKTAKYLKDLNLSEKEIFRFIVGAVGELDKPHDMDEIGYIETLKVLQGISYDDRKKTRNELLNCSLSDLKSLSEIVEKGCEENNICVLGNSDMIEKNKELFENIRNI